MGGQRSYSGNILTANRSEVRISGSFVPNGTSAVASTTIRGRLFTVAPGQSDGQWALTFTEKFPKLVDFDVDYAPASGQSVNRAQVSGDLTGNNQVTVQIVNGSTGALVTGVTTGRIFFEAVFENWV